MVKGNYTCQSLLCCWARGYLNWEFICRTPEIMLQNFVLCCAMKVGPRRRRFIGGVRGVWGRAVDDYRV